VAGADRPRSPHDGSDCPGPRRRGRRRLDRGAARARCRSPGDRDGPGRTPRRRPRFGSGCLLGPAGRPAEVAGEGVVVSDVIAARSSTARLRSCAPAARLSASPACPRSSRRTGGPSSSSSNRTVRGSRTSFSGSGRTPGADRRASTPAGRSCSVCPRRAHSPQDGHPDHQKSGGVRRSLREGQRQPGTGQAYRPTMGVLNAWPVRRSHSVPAMRRPGSTAAWVAIGSS
jgi:hypothetical protein